MEKDLDKVVEEIMATPNVNGCLVADHQGLCLAAKGTAHVDSAGIIVAISEQACKIQPNLKPPTVCLETDKKCVWYKGMAPSLEQFLSRKLSASGYTF